MEVEGKVQSLKFTLNKSMLRSLRKAFSEAISRHEALIMSRIKCICELKESVVDQKFANGASEQEADERTLLLRNLVSKTEQEKRAAERVELEKQEMVLEEPETREANALRAQVVGSANEVQKGPRSDQSRPSAEETLP